jgi:hypothetical protein
MALEEGDAGLVGQDDGLESGKRRRCHGRKLGEPVGRRQDSRKTPHAGAKARARFGEGSR